MKKEDIKKLNYIIALRFWMINFLVKHYGEKDYKKTATAVKLRDDPKFMEDLDLIRTIIDKLYD